jgi:hypothetical protein
MDGDLPRLFRDLVSLETEVWNRLEARVHQGHWPHGRVPRPCRSRADRPARIVVAVPPIVSELR